MHSLSSSSTNPNPDILNALTREGVLLHVSIRYWRAHKKLNPEDVGIDPAKLSDRLISLGHKRLMPKEALAPLALIESRAHALVEANTFPFLEGLAKYLPNARLIEVQEGLQELEHEFQNARTEFMRGYDQHRQQAMQEWASLAQRLVPDPERFLAAIRNAYPTPQKLARSFGFEVRLFQLALPAEISLQSLGFDQQREVVEARRHAAQEAAQRIHRDAEAFVAECVSSLREQTAQLCDEMLSSMENGKTDGVHQKTLNRLSAFIDQFRQMNFAGDREMEQQLERVRRELLNRSAADYRQSARAHRSLTQGLQEMRDHARHLAQQDAREIAARFGQMGQRRLDLGLIDHAA